MGSVLFILFSNKIIDNCQVGACGKQFAMFAMISMYNAVQSSC